VNRFVLRAHSLAELVHLGTLSSQCARSLGAAVAAVSTTDLRLCDSDEPASWALSGLGRRYSGCSAVRGGDQRTKQSCKLDIGTRPRAKPLLVWGCSNDLELPVEAATQQELRPPRVIGRGHNDDRTPSSSRCEVADHAGLSSGRVRIWLRAKLFELVAGCTQLVRGLPAGIAAIGDDQHRCDVLLQQHQGLAEALTTATGEDNQGVGWMGGIG